MPDATRIIHLFQAGITEQLAEQIRNWCPDFDHQDFRKILIFTNAHGLNPRKGKASIPFPLDSAYYHKPMPVYDLDFAMTFAEVTDLRYQELQERCHDRPWLVSWSGGLDSTTVLCSIIKNATPAQLRDVKVGLTAASIFENQEFFQQEIKGRFDLVDVNGVNILQAMDSHYVITGEPADLLLGGMSLMNAASHGLDITLPWQDNQYLLDYLDHKMGSSAGHWLYRLMADNVSGLTARDPPIVSVNDWFWWINFCWKWAATMNAISGPACSRPQKWLKNCAVPWYDSDLYQQWSMSQGRDHYLQHGFALQNYKIYAKRYIQSVTHLKYFHYFKTKMASSRMHALQAGWLALLDDFSALTEDDMDRVIALLPAYVHKTAA